MGRSPTAEETAIHPGPDLTATRYAQVLNAPIYRPEALTADPMVAHRLPRIREARGCSGQAGASPPSLRSSLQPLLPRTEPNPPPPLGPGDR